MVLRQDAIPATLVRRTHERVCIAETPIRDTDGFMTLVAIPRVADAMTDAMIT